MSLSSKRIPRHRRPPALRRVRGLGLIELMVSLVLGLLVVGGTLGIFMSNRQVYRATENLGRVQENARLAFELMARDLREAGGNPCDGNLPITNVLNDPAAAWWRDWSTGVVGYGGSTAMPAAAFGTTPPPGPNRVAGTDAIELKSGTKGPATVVSHDANSANFKVNTVDHGLDDGDIILICDFDHAAITQITDAQPGTNTTIVHNTGSSVSPGNCSKGLGIPLQCTSNGTGYTYGPNSVIALYQARAWYVGVNDGGRRSLFQTVLRNNGGTMGPETLEIADGVQDMQLQYLQDGAVNYADETAVTDWRQVSAVRIVLTLVSPEDLGTDGQPLQRSLEHVVTLRNRAP